MQVRELMSSDVQMISAEATVREIMTPRVLFSYEDEDLEQASAAMAEWKVRRLAVFNRKDHLVGMLALADLDTEGPPDEAAEALERVSEPGP